MSRPRASKIAPKLALLAEALLDAAMESDQTPLDQRIEVFKVCTTYHLGVTKVSAKMPTDDDPAGGGSFKDWRGKLRSVSNA